MADKPDIQRFLDAGDLEAVEVQVFGSEDPGAAAAALPSPTLADVVDSTRRIAYWERRAADVVMEADRMRAPIKAELAKVDRWEAGELELPQQRIRFHKGRSVAYYLANRPPGKVKNIKLPNGVRISCKQPALTWTWPKDADLVAAVKAIRPELVRKPVVETVDKNEIKKLAEVTEDFQVIMVNADGEAVALVGVTVTTPPEEFTVDIGE